MENMDLSIINISLELVEKNAAEISSASNFEKISFGSLSSIGAGISSTIPAFKKSIESILVDVPDNVYAAFDENGAATPLKYRFKGTTNFIGSNRKRGELFQTRFSQIDNLSGTKVTEMPIDPTMLFMAMALVAIDKKLDVIKELQQKIINFLESDKRAELESSLTFLTEILSSYKFNWENDTYRNNAHLKTQDIKQLSEHNIVFYRKRILSESAKSKFLNTSSAVKNKLQQLQSDFNDYQLSLYLFGYSSFVETLLLFNFSSEYLNSVSKQIEKYLHQYMEDYTNCYNSLEEDYQKSVRGLALNGIATASGKLGKAVSKIPVISNSQLDENLIASEDTLKSFNGKTTTNAMLAFTESRDGMVRPFINLIDRLNVLHNQTNEFYFDEDGLYLKIS